MPHGISLALEALFPVKFPSSDELAISKDISAPVVISLSRPVLDLLPQNLKGILHGFRVSLSNDLG